MEDAEIESAFRDGMQARRWVLRGSRWFDRRAYGKCDVADMGDNTSVDGEVKGDDLYQRLRKCVCLTPSRTERRFLVFAEEKRGFGLSLSSYSSLPSPSFLFVRVNVFLLKS